MPAPYVRPPKKPGDYWFAVFTDPETKKRRQHRAHTEDEAQEIINHEMRLRETGTASLRRARAQKNGFPLKEAFELTCLRRWNGQKSSGETIKNAKALCEFFGWNTSLEAIDALAFEDCRDYHKKRGIKNTTINKYMGPLSAMRQEAVRYGKTQLLPPLPGNLPIEKIPPRFFTEEEVESFCAAWRIKAKSIYANGDEQEMIDLFLFRLEIGSRLGELLDAKGKDVSLSSGTITLWKTKNGNPRTIPLTSKAKRIISKYLPEDPNEKIWSIKSKRWGELWRYMKKTLRIPKTDRVVGHGCRHTMATRLTTNNVSTQVIKHMGGWESTSSMDRYAHMTVEGMLPAVKVLESFDE
jgi:integrase